MIEPTDTALDRTPPVHAFNLFGIALLLDVDGTLLDLALRPNEVEVPQELCAVLKSLAECQHCVLALVSGRPVIQLDALFSPLKFSAIGCHGAELRESPDAPIKKRAGLGDKVRAELYALAAKFPGTQLEDKHYSIAIHYRSMPASEQPLSDAIEDLLQRHGGIELLAGKAVFEVKPQGYDKATACTALLKHPRFSGRKPVFLGDDITDERVFRIMPELGGIGISVGRPMDGAKYMLRSPAAVRSWLHELAMGNRL